MTTEQASPYLCPSCKTNKTRFNLIEQVVTPVKKNPQTGEIVEEYEDLSNQPMHMPYRGAQYRVQCAACGVIEEEISFIKRAEYNKSS
ncbi:MULTISPECIES: DNA alkylation repair protein [Pontibacillus]|uniref:DNA alkylation repair protein n=1 Tax=Pontibacillus chungwhensis TaxID=265426 RepID=A0ABY8V0E9_9BACI|nr:MULTISPECIES: DNA alkylation repair protein [Pontibacillus]MCD5322128.1 DNA alkylation repair protein [Pontibacillus sp. HN14]WIF99426.1 DNA alkylation repair protein [Pontibacillus chungwhensis]